MNQNRKGCLSEKIALVYLLKKGLDVFDSCQPYGAVDLLTFNPATGETKAWEIKTENFRLSGPKKGTRIARPRRDTNFTRIINMLYVNLETELCREGKRKNE
jgi:hypothetical protein